MADERRTVLITFKQKDKRPKAARGKDKLEVVADLIKSDVSFLTAADVTQGAAIAMPAEAIGYDVDEYDAPIVTASLTDQEIAALRRNGSVEEVEDDGEVYALEAPAGQFEVEGQPSPLAETIPTGVNQIKAPLGWDCSRGKAIKVAVLDTGIAGAHPDLAPNYRGGISFVPGETSPDDFNGHGTHCAGTIAAAVNGSGVVGVAPTAYLYAVKVLDGTGSGAWSNLVAGIDWCIKRGIRILSMSLGSPAAAPNAVKTICDAAWNRGRLLVAAAGNDGGPVGFPARYATVLAVSALDSANVIAPFSNRGPDIELSAPGVQVLSTLPGGGYGRLDGTSMACPHVSGAAALAWGSHRWADNVAIRRLLAKTADNLGPPGRDPNYGFGRVDAKQAACSLTRPGPVLGLP
ncbi:MAG: S8 family peptidase [Thermoleophilaceae bacterium]